MLGSIKRGITNLVVHLPLNGLPALMQQLIAHLLNHIVRLDGYFLDTLSFAFKTSEGSLSYFCAP